MTADIEIGNKQFGAWLRRRRKSLGLTQDKLGLRAMCSGYAISKIELGERRPSRQLAELLAGVMGVQAEEREAFINFARATSDHKSSAAWQRGAAFQTPWRSDTLPQGQEYADPPNNLPAPLTPFIGREGELRRLGERLVHSGVRLLTLMGPPGAGKTRLALELARHLAGNFEHGVFLVELAPLRDPTLVPSAIAHALEITGTPSQPLIDTVKAHLANRHILLVLDNFEHLLEAGTLVSKLLETCPELKVLATSREPLNLYPEYRFEVPPLQVPDRKQLEFLSTHILGRYEAVKLFEERARALIFDFSLTDENTRAIAQMCYQLEGLPLAIELAVASMGTTYLRSIETSMQPYLQLLKSTALDLPAKHRSLQGAIAWSYDLLSDPEKQLFRRLAVFRGGFTLDAAAAVCLAIGDNSDLSSHLNTLVGKSLLHRQRNPYPQCRFRFSMLEPIREFADDLVGEAGEAEELRRNHAHFFAALAEEDTLRRDGAGTSAWYDRLEIEHNNLRAALAWALGPEGEAETALRLATALRGFWALRGYLNEAEQWLTRALEGGQKVPTWVRAAALFALADIHWREGHLAECKTYLPEALDLFTALQDNFGVASCLTLQADCALLHGNYSPDGMSEGRALLEQSLLLFSEIGDTEGVARVLSKLGEFARLDGQYGEAERLYSEVIPLAEDISWADMVSIQLHNLGHVAAHGGDHERATSLFTRSLIMSGNALHKQLAALCLLGLAGAAGSRGKTQRAAVLFGAGDNLLSSVGASLNRPDRIEYNRNLVVARSQLDGQTWEVLYAQGREMSFETAIEYALEED